MDARTETETEAGGPAREPASGRLARPRRRDLAWLGMVTIMVALPAWMLAIASAAYSEWHVATWTAPPGLPSHDAVLKAVAIACAPIGLLLAMTPPVFLYILRSRRDKLPVLAGTARRIAAGEHLRIPYQDDENEIGALAMALGAWQEATTMREVLLRAAPVGICHLDANGVVVASNDAALATLGYAREEVDGRRLRDLAHPDDTRVGEWMRNLVLGPNPGPVSGELRLRRADGSYVWCSLSVTPVPRQEHAAPTVIVILQDVSERRRQVDWAAAVQREMLPASSPRLPGWELAGRWLPAQDVAGDLFDWVETEDGHLELTLADVMGKGMGAALVMSALRSALRAARPSLGPAARVKRAARSMTFGTQNDGLFVTLFHGRLELATGRLRYVDAGHGYCLVRRAGGAVERLEARSLPVGLGLGEVFVEGEITLDAGDTLVICSDGLLEVDEAAVAVDQMLTGLDPAAGAAATADLLLARVAGPLSDDVTLVVLRRQDPDEAVADPGVAGPTPAAAPRPESPERRGGAGQPAAAGRSTPALGTSAEESSPVLTAEDSGVGLLLRYLSIPSYCGALYVLVAVTTVVVYLEWRLGTGDVGLRHPDGRTMLLAVAAPLLASLPWLALNLALSLRAVRLGTSPLAVLASRATQIAAGERVPIPYQDRDDEIGDLALALRGWQEAAAVRDVLLRRAPLGISRLDLSAVVLSSNDAACAILGYRRDELEGRTLLDLLDPEDRHQVDRVGRALAVPGTEWVAVEVRLRRGDGSRLWCATVVAPIRPEGERLEGYIHILEDVSERKRQAEWASAVQREMLPARAPRLASYEIAGRCLTAQEVAGDLYDWLETDDGHLELTLADVMGKGMGAALLMAALRTALRAAPGELGPAERVTRAAASMTFGAGAEGLFVTLFHARLHLASGAFRYVDAGHGYVLIRRAGGLVVRLPVRSVPLGIGMGQTFEEGEARLDPGDLLVACSDGLLELSDTAVDVEAIAAGLEPGVAAATVIDRLLERVSGLALADDVTVVVLRRLQAAEEAARWTRVSAGLGRTPPGTTASPPVSPAHRRAPRPGS
jgi:PAS domain S-box-containing protein